MHIKCTYGFVLFFFFACVVGRGWGEIRGNGPGTGGQPVFLSLSGRREGAESTEGPEEGSSRLMLSDHRCLRSALYMAKPSTAHTVAPRLALSQKVEFFRSAWAMCLLRGSTRWRAGEGKEHAVSKKREQHLTRWALWHNFIYFFYIAGWVAKWQDKVMCSLRWKLPKSGL